MQLAKVSDPFPSDHALPGFDLSACSQLRAIEIHIEFSPFNFHGFTTWLASTAGTITSPRFHRFILVIEDAHCPKLFGRADGREALKLVDQALWHLSQRNGMKMIVKERVLRGSFRNEIEKAFPLMVSAGAFEFEFNDPQPCLY